MARHDAHPAWGARHAAWRRFAPPAPNDLWQMDVKGHVALAAAGGDRRHPRTVRDDHSRFLPGLVACGGERDGTGRP